MYLTTDNATAQAKLLIGPERCLRLEPKGADAEIEMDDYDSAMHILPSLAADHFEIQKSELEVFFETTTSSRERHHTEA